MEEEIKNQELENVEGQEENSFFNLQTIIQTLILNWKRFVLSVIICLGAAAIYKRKKLIALFIKPWHDVKFNGYR